MTNLQTIKKHDIQIGDFVDIKTVANGFVTLCVIDILSSGIIHGLDANGWEHRYNARQVVKNCLQ